MLHILFSEKELEDKNLPMGRSMHMHTVDLPSEEALHLGMHSRPWCYGTTALTLLRRRLGTLTFFV